MILLLLALVILGFFFPPAWLFLAIYVAYLAITKERRRERIITRYVSAMVASNTHYAVIKNLYFDAAKAYAKSKGYNPSLPDENIAFSDVNSSKGKVHVCFQRNDDGGTIITIMG